MVGIPDNLAFEPKIHFSGKSYLFLCLKYHRCAPPTEISSLRTARTHFFALLPGSVSLEEAIRYLKFKMRKSSTEIYCWTLIYFDGAAEPTNPGPAAGAAIIDLPTGESLTVTVDLGVQTNNVAEYSGAIAGLKKALELGYKRIKLLGDSQLVIYQMEGAYRCKNAGLQPLYQEARQLLKQFESYSLEWVPRSQNSRADAAAGEVLKAKQAVPAFNIPDELPVPEPREELRTKIRQLRAKGEQAGFKEWLSLKSGRDGFSSLRGEALAEYVPIEVREAISLFLRPDEDEQFAAKVYRWYLRGLPPALALRKCRVDAEVSANAKSR